MHYVVILFLLSCSLSTFALEQFKQRLHFPTSVTYKYDDTKRWISIEKSLFDDLLQTAGQEENNKEELLSLKRNIVSGIINLQSTEPDIMLTEREFYAGLLQYLPWDGIMMVGAPFVRVLIKDRPTILNIGRRSFWHPNEVKIIPQT